MLNLIWNSCVPDNELWPVLTIAVPNYNYSYKVGMLDSRNVRSWG